jgi:hypothetical protein
MARFPDETELGVLPAENAENAEALNDAGPQGSTSIGALEIAKADAEYLTRTKALQDAVASEADPDGLRDKYEPLFRQTHDSSAALISDPSERNLWVQSHAADLDGQILATSDRGANLTRAREIAAAGAQLDGIRDAAVQSVDERQRANFIKTANGLIAGLQQAGYLDETEARERQKSWAEDFALSAFSRLPPADQVKWLERDPQEPAASKGDLFDFVPEEKRGNLLQSAKIILRNEELTAQSAAALERHQVGERIRDDLAAIVKGRAPSTDLSEERVQSVLGPELGARWREEREIYQRIHEQSRDFYALTDSEIESRLRALKPADEGAEPGNATIFRAVQEQADDLRHLRLTDPARSVADDPLVRAAAERAQSGDPQAAGELRAARLAAQERAGIDPSAQSPITKDEAVALMAPVRDAKPEQARDVLRQTGDDFVNQFGADAARALAFAFRAMASDTREITATSEMLTAIARGGATVEEPPQLSDVSISANDTAAEDTAAGFATHAESAGDTDLAPDASREDHRASLPITSDPLFGWEAIGSRAQEQDGSDVALASLIAASGRDKGKGIGSILDFLRRVPPPPPPPRDDKEPPRQQIPDIPPLPPREPHRTEPDTLEQDVSRTPDRSTKEASSSVPQHVRDTLLPGGKAPPGVRPGWNEGDWEWPGGKAAAEKIFSELRQTATPYVPRSDYPGTMHKFPGGGTVGLRLESTSGPPSIDLNIPGFDEVRKLKFLEK